MCRILFVFNSCSTSANTIFTDAVTPVKQNKWTDIKSLQYNKPNAKRYAC